MRFRVCCLVLSVSPIAAGPGTSPPPFDPGPIFGFAAGVTGGTRKPECVVAATADSGPDSLCSVLTEGGPAGRCISYWECRVRFEVAGTTTLLDPILLTTPHMILTTPHMSLDGSNAPSAGAQSTNDWVRVDSENVIVRHMRFRPNDPQRSIWAFNIGSDVAGVTPRRVLIDHCSFEWATRATLGLFGYNATSTRDVIVQNSLLAEALTVKKGGFGALVYGDVAQVSFYRNLFLSNPNRNPQITTGLADGGAGATLFGTADFQIVQNVTHNFIYGTRAYSASPTWTQRMQLIGNVYVWRPTNCKVPIMVFSGGDECGTKTNQPCWVGPTVFHVSGNSVERHAGATLQDCDTFSDEETNQPCAHWAPYDSTAAGERFWNPTSCFTMTWIDALSPCDVEATVLANADATLPCRDTVDARIVKTVQARAGRDIATGGAVSPPTPLPDPPVCEAPHP